MPLKFTVILQSHIHTIYIKNIYVYVEKHSVQEMPGTKNKEYTFIKLLRSDHDMSVPYS